MDAMEQIVREQGFESVEEFNRLVASVDLGSGEKLLAFKRWQSNDGSKEGLVQLLANT
jgi:hypothetical protein